MYMEQSEPQSAEYQQYFTICEVQRVASSVTAGTKCKCLLHVALQLLSF